MQWAYLSYQPDNAWTFQVGRKRLPLFLYYDILDVGYAINMIRPATAVYGWEVTNYNGASADYQFSAGGWSLRSELFGGEEHTRDNGYQALYLPSPQNVDWRNIIVF